jgi:hypothetical protein
MTDSLNHCLWTTGGIGDPSLWSDTLYRSHNSAAHLNHGDSFSNPTYIPTINEEEPITMEAQVWDDFPWESIRYQETKPKPVHYMPLDFLAQHCSTMPSPAYNSARLLPTAAVQDEQALQHRSSHNDNCVDVSGSASPSDSPSVPSTNPQTNWFVQTGGQTKPKRYKRSVKCSCKATMTGVLDGEAHRKSTNTKTFIHRQCYDEYLKQRRAKPSTESIAFVCQGSCKPHVFRHNPYGKLSLQLHCNRSKTRHLVGSSSQDIVPIVSVGSDELEMAPTDDRQQSQIYKDPKHNMSAALSGIQIPLPATAISLLPYTGRLLGQTQGLSGASYTLHTNGTSKTLGSTVPKMPRNKKVTIKCACGHGLMSVVNRITKVEYSAVVIHSRCLTKYGSTHPSSQITVFACTNYCAQPHLFRWEPSSNGKGGLRCKYQPRSRLQSSRQNEVHVNQDLIAPDLSWHVKDLHVVVT